MTRPVQSDNSGRERALIYIPPSTEPEKCQEVCLLYCEERGYEVAALVQEPPESDEAGTRWDNGVWPMVRTGGVDVLVICELSWCRMPNRWPRLELAPVRPSAGNERRPRPRPLER